MRAAGSLTGLDGLRPRDHVCWVVGTPEEYDERLLAALDDGARSGDRLVVFGPEERLPAASTGADGVALTDPAVSVLGGRFEPAGIYEMFRREAAAARDEGYRALRVVADMDWLLAFAPDVDDLVSFELLLDEVVADVAATVVCAYRTGSFDAAKMASVVAVHPLELGRGPADLGFRMWSCGPGSWDVIGEIDLSSAAEFRTALFAAAQRTSALRLRMAGTRFVDLAGVRAIAAVAAEHPDLPIAVERPTETFRRCWALLRFDRELPSVSLVPPQPADAPDREERPA